MASITLYIDAVSNYGYIALHLLETHFARTPLTVKPVFLGGIMGATGNRPPFSVPLKGAYMKHDYQRACRRYNVPIRSTMPAKFPVNTLMCQRVQTAAILALGQKEGQKVVVAMEKGLWVDAKDVEQEEECKEIVAKAVGDDKAALVWKTLKEEGDKVKAELKRVTEEAIASGAFGVPWMVVESKTGEKDIIWGVDHLDVVAEMCGVQWPPAKKEVAQL